MRQPGDDGREAEAIAALTAMAREQSSSEGFAGIAARVLSAVAANVGGVQALLAGRPRSWEAGVLAELVDRTAGEDLPRFRTEPIRVCMNPEITLDGMGVEDLYQLDDVEKAHEVVVERVRTARYLDHPDVRAVVELPVIPWVDGRGGQSEAEDAAAREVLLRAEKVAEADPEVQVSRRRLEAAYERRAQLFAAWRAQALALVVTEVARRGYTVEVVDDDDLSEQEWGSILDIVEGIDLWLALPGTDIRPADHDLHDEGVRARIAAQLTAAGLSY